MAKSHANTCFNFEFAHGYGVKKGIPSMSTVTVTVIERKIRVFWLRKHLTNGLSLAPTDLSTDRGYESIPKIAHV